ncbi:hypothetical protein ACFY30_14570 [Streptomyces sp. NPDC000345]|uniref:hypothetical protein n=1 Tax=Streptomyces sp. NPDC000345 TaxID=3364537 RepID=UPI0036BA74D0
MRVARLAGPPAQIGEGAQREQMAGAVPLFQHLDEGGAGVPRADGVAGQATAERSVASRVEYQGMARAEGFGRLVGEFGEVVQSGGHRALFNPEAGLVQPYRQGVRVPRAQDPLGVPPDVLQRCAARCTPSCSAPPARA